MDCVNMEKILEKPAGKLKFRYKFYAMQEKNVGIPRISSFEHIFYSRLIKIVAFSSCFFFLYVGKLS